MKTEGACPCGGGVSYTHCCEPFHTGQALPPTAEALMRSRYSAFVLGLADYLEYEVVHCLSTPTGDTTTGDH